MEFIAAIVVPLSFLIKSSLAVTSNTLDFWVNLNTPTPLTGDGSTLVGYLAEMATSYMRALAGFLAPML
jgi:3-hydroxy-3-methylglutaryl CoA synthase